MSATLILNTLRTLTPQYSNEDELQRALAEALEDVGVFVHREHLLDLGNRIDLYCPLSATGIEVKIKGSARSVTRQLTRYAAFDEIHDLVLVTTRSAHHHVPATIGTTPVHLVTYVEGGL